MLLRLLESGDIPAAVALIRESYEKFVAHDYTPEGSAHFYEYASEQGLSERMSSGNYLMLAAIVDGTLVGLIEMRDNNHCSLLFVKPKYHGQGIGRWLFEEAVARCRVAKPDLRTIGVRSSPYAVPVYAKLGFRKLGVLEEQHGIVYQPMEYTV